MLNRIGQFCIKMVLDWIAQYWTALEAVDGNIGLHSMGDYEIVWIGWDMSLAWRRVTLGHMGPRIVDDGS